MYTPKTLCSKAKSNIIFLLPSLNRFVNQQIKAITAQCLRSFWVKLSRFVHLQNVRWIKDQLKICPGFWNLARLGFLSSWTLQRGVRSSHHGGISALFSEFFPSLPPFLFVIYFIFFLYSTDLVSVMSARAWGLMADLWGFPAKGVLFHLGGQLTSMEAPLYISGTHPPYT